MVSANMIHVDCEQCGTPFEVADTLAGGLTNCPGCGKATPVPGLRDPYYRLLQIGTAIGWVLLTAFGWIRWLVGALVASLGAGLVIALVHVAL